MGTNTNVKANPSKYQQSIARLIAGFQQAFPSGSTLIVNGTALTAAKIIAQLQPILDEYQAVLDARANLQGKLATAKANRTSEHEFVMQVHGALVAYFGRGNPQLTQFGFSPLKPRKTTGAKTATKAAKAAKTRDLRNTMGKVEKQDVKFGYTPTTVTVANGKAVVADPPAPAVQSDPSGSQSTASPPAVAPNVAPVNAPPSGGSVSGPATPSSGS